MISPMKPDFSFQFFQIYLHFILFYVWTQNYSATKINFVGFNFQLIVNFH